MKEAGEGFQSLGPGWRGDAREDEAAAGSRSFEDGLAALEIERSDATMRTHTRGLPVCFSYICFA